MNRLGVAGYQIVVQAHISSQLANLVIGTKRTVEQTILPQSMAALPSAVFRITFEVLGAVVLVSNALAPFSCRTQGGL
jgi:hypothetical protein